MEAKGKDSSIHSSTEKLERLREVCGEKGISFIFVNETKGAPSIIYNKTHNTVLVFSSATDFDIEDFISTYIT